jgi:hypothetical protein
MTLPQKAAMNSDKWTGAKDSLRIIAKKGESVLIYNIDHSPVFLCLNSKNETFSVHMTNLIIK